MIGAQEKHQHRPKEGNTTCADRIESLHPAPTTNHHVFLFFFFRYRYAPLGPARWGRSWGSSPPPPSAGPPARAWPPSFLASLCGWCVGCWNRFLLSGGGQRGEDQGGRSPETQPETRQRITYDNPIIVKPSVPPHTCLSSPPPRPAPLDGRPRPPPSSPACVPPACARCYMFRGRGGYTLLSKGGGVLRPVQDQAIGLKSSGPNQPVI